MTNGMSKQGHVVSAGGETGSREGRGEDLPQPQPGCSGKGDGAASDPQVPEHAGGRELALR